MNLNVTKINQYLNAFMQGVAVWNFSLHDVAHLFYVMSLTCCLKQDGRRVLLGRETSLPGRAGVLRVAEDSWRENRDAPNTTFCTTWRGRHNLVMCFCWV